MPPLRILQVLPALGIGGVERGTLQMADALVRRGHVSLVMSEGGVLLPALRATGSVHLDRPVGRKSLAAVLEIGRLRRWLAAHPVDLVHARSRLPAWIAWWAIRGLPVARRPRFVTTFHGPYTPTAWSGVMTRGDRVIAISEFVRDHALRHWPRLEPARIAVIPRGIDPAEYPRGHRPSPAWIDDFAAQVPTAGRCVLTLPGRLTRWKGQLDFLELLAALRARGLSVVGLLAGGAAPRAARYETELRRRAAASDLAGCVHFLGERRDLREILAVSDVVCSLTREPEAFGRTTLEALALGRPVLGWDHGGTGEILRACFPSGLCPPGDLEAAVSRVLAWQAGPPTPGDCSAYALGPLLAREMDLYEALVAGVRP